MKNNSPEVINILTADSSKLQELEGLVRLNNGLLHCRVHDDWNGYLPSNISFEEAKVLYLKKLLKSRANGVLFFDDALSLALLGRKTYIDPDIPLFTVTTEEGWGRLTQHGKNFPKLVDILHSIGVEEVHVGGKYMVFHAIRDTRKDHDPDRLKIASYLPGLIRQHPEITEWAVREIKPGLKTLCIPFGCAGTVAANLLIAGFRVKISEQTSWPMKVMTPDEYDRTVHRGKYWD